MPIQVKPSAVHAASGSPAGATTATAFIKTAEGKKALEQHLSGIVAKINRDHIDTDGIKRKGSTWGLTAGKKAGEYLIEEKNAAGNTDFYRVTIKGDTVRATRSDVFHYQSGAWEKEVKVAKPITGARLGKALHDAILVGKLGVHGSNGRTRLDTAAERIEAANR